MPCRVGLLPTNPTTQGATPINLLELLAGLLPCSPLGLQINHEFRGRGTAYVDVKRLKTLQMKVAHLLRGVVGIPSIDGTRLSAR